MTVKNIIIICIHSDKSEIIKRHQQFIFLQLYIYHFKSHDGKKTAFTADKSEIIKQHYSFICYNYSL